MAPCATCGGEWTQVEAFAYGQNAPETEERDREAFDLESAVWHDPGPTGCRRVSSTRTPTRQMEPPVSDALLTLAPFTGDEPRMVTYLRTADLARRWATTPGALAQMRYRGSGPAFVKIPGIGVRYALEVVEAYERAGR